MAVVFVLTVERKQYILKELERLLGAINDYENERKSRIGQCRAQNYDESSMKKAVNHLPLFAMTNWRYKDLMVGAFKQCGNLLAGLYDEMKSNQVDLSQSFADLELFVTAVLPHFSWDRFDLPSMFELFREALALIKKIFNDEPEKRMPSSKIVEETPPRLR